MSIHQVSHCDSLMNKVLGLFVATVSVLMVYSSEIVQCAETTVKDRVNWSRSLRSIPLETLDSLLSRNRASVDKLLGPKYFECACRAFFQYAGVKNWHMVQGYVDVNPKYIDQHASLFAMTGSTDETTKQLFQISTGREDDSNHRERMLGSVRRHQAFVVKDDSALLVRVTKFVKVGTIDRGYYRLRPRLEITLFLGEAWSVTITDFRNSTPETVAGVGLERIVAAGRDLYQRLQYGGAFNPTVSPNLHDTALEVKKTMAKSVSRDGRRRDSKSVKNHQLVGTTKAPTHMLLRTAAIFVPVDSSTFAIYDFRTRHANHPELFLGSVDIVTESMSVDFTYTESVVRASHDYKYSPEAHTDERHRTQVVWIDRNTVAMYRRYENNDDSKSVNGYFTVYLTSPRIAVGLYGDAGFIKSVFDRIVKIPDLAARIVAARTTPIGICGDP